jgi:hypothetical protein
MLSSEQNDELSDTTDDDSSNVAGSIKIFHIIGFGVQLPMSGQIFVILQRRRYQRRLLLFNIAL